MRFERRIRALANSIEDNVYTTLKLGPRGMMSNEQLRRRRCHRVIRSFLTPVIVILLILLYRELQNTTADIDLSRRDLYAYSDYAQGLGNQDYSQLYAQYQNVPGSNNGFADVAIAPFVDQAVQLPVPVKENPVPVQQEAPVIEKPANPAVNINQPVNPPVIAAAPAPVQPEVKPELNVEPVDQKPAEPEKPAEPVKAMFQGGEKAEHAMMLQDDVKVAVKEKKDPLPMPALKQGLTESKEYRGDVVWPTMAELQVPQEIKDKNEDWYKLGINRQRQKAHGTEIPTVRYPDLIITGAKKCGTTALKIFMNYHTWFQDTPGERHFFNRPSNWKLGYQWYHDQMPLTFKDEICYEKTPDYFDRPFIPERMSALENAKDIKFVHVLCDPVRRSFSHFLHMFTVQAVGQGGVGAAQPGFEFLNANFGDISKEDAFEKTVELAFTNLLGKEKDIDQMTDDEIRDAVNDYYTRWDLKPGSPNRVYPLRIPDAVLTGSLYAIHIRTYLHYFTQDQMLYLDATELIENPGMSLRRVADFAGVPPLINENNFYFDEEKGYYCMTPPVESGRESFCLGSSKGRSKDKSLPTELKRRIRRFFAPFVEDLGKKFTGDEYGHWDW